MHGVKVRIREQLESASASILEAFNAVNEAESSLQEAPAEEVSLGETEKTGLGFVVVECEGCEVTSINPSKEECWNCGRLLEVQPIEFGPDAHISDWGVITGYNSAGKEIKIDTPKRPHSRCGWNQEKEKAYYQRNTSQSSIPFETWVCLRKEPEEKKAPWAVFVGDKVRARYLNKYDAVRLYDALRYAFEGNV